MYKPVKLLILGMCFVHAFVGLTRTSLRSFPLTLNWNEIRIAFEKFYVHPGINEAREVLRLLPIGRVDNYNGDREEVMRLVFHKNNYGILRNEIYYGNSVCLDIAIRLHEFSDGHYAEQLDETIGVLIRINPRLFLSKMNEYREIFEKDGRRWPVDILPPEYVDRLEAQAYEIEMRIKAIETVKDKCYAEIKTICIDQLKRRKQEILETSKERVR